MRITPSSGLSASELYDLIEEATRNAESDRREGKSHRAQPGSARGCSKTHSFVRSSLAGCCHPTIRVRQVDAGKRDAKRPSHEDAPEVRFRSSSSNGLRG